MTWRYSARTPPWTPAADRGELRLKVASFNLDYTPGTEGSVLRPDVPICPTTSEATHSFLVSYAIMRFDLFAIVVWLSTLPLPCSHDSSR